MKVLIPSVEDLPDGHPCATKYRWMYLDHILEIAGTSVEAYPVKEPLPGLVLTYVFKDKRVRAQVCYSDYPEQGLLTDVDLVIKLKYALRCKDLYDAHPCPVFPGGFLGGPQFGSLKAGREWYQLNLTRLRNNPGESIQLVKAGCLNGGAVRGGYEAMKGLEDEGRAPFARHIDRVASAKFCLNVCGNGNSIDRKVVDYCGVGAAILSTTGLEDYVMPYGERFRHGENIWYVTSMDSLDEAMGMKEDLRLSIISQSQETYDKCFSPTAMSQWWRDCAMSVA